MSLLRLVGIIAVLIVGSLLCTFGMLWLVKRDESEDRLRKVRSDITAIKEAFDMHAMQHVGIYPASLDVLVTPDMNGYRYLRRTTIPEDPCGGRYGYEPPTPAHPQARVYTLGAAGKPGGTGDDEDIDYEAIVNGR